MTKDFEEHYKRFCKAVDDALTLWPGSEIEAVIGEEAYDPDIQLDCGDGSSVKAYTDEDGRMVFKPQEGGEKDV